MSIGNAIKNKREELNISQVELAKRIGKSKSMICKIEKGVNDINTKNLAEIAKVLDCSICDLIKEV